MLRIVAAVTALSLLTAPPAIADLSKLFGRASAKQVRQTSPALLPPPGYTDQWWTAPNNCEYSRAGRPGETVWYLIINTAHRGCDAYLVEHGFADAY